MLMNMPPSPKAKSWLTSRRLRGARGPYGPTPSGPEPQTSAPLAAPRRRGPPGRPKIPNRAWWWAAGLLFAGGSAVLMVAVWLAGGVRAQLAPSANRPGAAASPQAQAALPGPSAAVTVLLSADAPIGEHHLFWLNEPRRLVVDLMGVGAAVAAPIVAPKHPLVRRMRWGRHDDRVRFVLEVAPQTHDAVQARPDGASLAVTLHPLEAARE
jgi:hypothetical protein